MPLRPRGRLLLAGATLLVVYLLTGCLSFGDSKYHEVVRTEVVEQPPAGPLVGDGVLQQSGGATLAANAEQDVYYPIPYVGPPNLSVNSTFSDCELIAQTRDHFRIKNPHGSSRDITWTAKGVKVLITPAPPVEQPVTKANSSSPSTAPGPLLPSQPIPYSP